jgi:predicted transcriptional regulator of viral defense system
MSSLGVENSKNGAQKSAWTFLTNHSHVLICLDLAPEATLREVANSVRITERAVQRIVADLEAEGILIRVKQGRRNCYQIQKDLPLRHPVEAHRTIGELIALGLPKTNE